MTPAAPTRIEAPPMAMPQGSPWPYRSPEYEQLRTLIEQLADIVDRLEKMERDQQGGSDGRREPDR